MDLDPRVALRILHEWKYWARGNQLAPSTDWRTWLILAGRGWGKTRTGAEWILERAQDDPKGRGALIGRTTSDVRDVMIEGESGIMACAPPWFRPEFEPSKRRLTFPNGCVVTGFTAEKPDLLRGPQHGFAWADELAAWQRLKQTWSNLMFGLRIGENPQVVITTTPRPLHLIRSLVKRQTTHVTNGTTYDNRANLHPAFFEEIIAEYEGTTLGAQELKGLLLEEMPGSLWTREVIDRNRVDRAPELERVCVGVDPAVSNNEDSDATGIVASGIGVDGHGYVLTDASIKASPGTWAKTAVDLLETVKGDRIIAEVNNGGDLVEATIRTVEPDVPYRAVHASRGKQTRAEPIAALYEQGRIHHVGMFEQLEDQLCNWEPGTSTKSPDILDAMVWTMWFLMRPKSRRGATGIRIDPDVALRDRPAP